MSQIYQGSEPYIFISYSHEDSDQVIPIIQALMDRGFRVWYDSAIEAGKEWREDIAERIVSCSVLIAFLSPNYVKSPNCRREVLFAEAERKDMVIAQLEEAELTPGMRMTLGALQHKFAWNYPNREAFADALCDAQIVQVCLSTKTGAGQKPGPAEVKKPMAAPQNSFETLLGKAKQGDAQAQLQVGNCYYDGKGVEKDLTQAAYWYEKAAKQDLAEAQHKWAWALFYGEGVTKNWQLAAQQWYQAALKGHAKAQNSYGVCCARGEGVPQNYAKAMQWYQKAAEQGDINALHNLYKVYKNGNTVVNKDPEKAAQWLEKAAALGDADAQLNVGLNMIKGLGKVDHEEGFRWIMKAAEQGNARAMYHVANCYLKCYGVEWNADEAVKWFKKAVDKGDTWAMDALAECYENGCGVPKDRAEARRLRRQAKKAPLW